MSERLSGGNTNAVFREGDTVRRQTGPWTPTVHRLLRHLRGNGIDWIPEVRGMDPGGHERLSYLPGTVPQYPMPRWIWDRALLDVAGQRLRDLHDASTDFDTSRCTWALEPREPVEVICHNDVAPYNMVFDEDQRFVGLIDFDAAAPGPRLWDLAYLAYRLVPLHAPGNLEVPPSSDPVRLERIERLLAAYGHTASPEPILQACIERVEAVRDFTRERADATDGDTFGPHLQSYEADLLYLRHFVA